MRLVGRRNCILQFYISKTHVQLRTASKLERTVPTLSLVLHFNHWLSPSIGRKLALRGKFLHFPQ